MILGIYIYCPKGTYNFYVIHFKFKILNRIKNNAYFCCGRRSDLMVSALDLGASGPGLSLGWGHCVVFLGKTLYFQGASLHPEPG